MHLYHEPDDYIPFINISIGTPYQHFGLNLDINCRLTWMSPINELKTSIYQTNLIEAKQQMDFYSIEGIESEDQFKVDEIEISQYPFLIPIDSVGADNMKGAIGLSRLISPKYSIIHHAYNQGIISKRRFMIAINTFLKNYGLLTIGGFSDYYNFSTNQFFHCPIRNKEDEWNCNLNYVFIGNMKDDFSPMDKLNDKGMPVYQIDLTKTQYYQINVPVFFSSIDNYLFVPKHFFQWLKEIYLKEEMDNKNCNEKMIANDIAGFECNVKAIGNLKQVNLIFESFAVRLGIGLFIQQKGTLTYLLAIVHKQKYDKWLFGLVFLKNSNMFFDYDLDEITFYSSFAIDYVNILNSQIGNDNKNEDRGEPSIDYEHSHKAAIRLLILLLSGIVLCGILIQSIILVINAKQKVC